MLKKLKPFIVAGLSIKTTNENNQAQLDIPKLWERFFQENISSQIANKKDETIYVVYTDYESDFTKPYRVIIGYALSNAEQKISSSLTRKIIPALDYEVFEVSGKYPESLMKTWEDIWKSKLNRAYEVDLEVYKQNFNPQDAKLDIYISVRK
jgi:predicted transcriptional regulator YdeE